MFGTVKDHVYLGDKVKKHLANVSDSFEDVCEENQIYIAFFANTKKLNF